MSGLRLRVDTIVNKDDTAGTGFASTVGIPTGQSITAPNTLHFTGINTVGILSATSANITGIVTATVVGDGSALTGIPVVTASKAIAFAYIQQ